ncbi:tissue inhibitor of metalloproteinase [Nematostella vectensis]|uniref:tissue inhibitor of metalloproteinase n=1 Tax=Nematostella vectensis TaxID=45351 RepID=UPI002077147C|nr:tissue inhibitor of metalloproteinase [Nematostella vectensis]
MNTFLLVVLVVGFVKRSFECSCMPSHPQEQFCRADFAIRVKVIDGPKEELPENYPKGVPVAFFVKQVYTVRITKFYKGKYAVNATGKLDTYGTRGRLLKIKIYTPSKASSCSVRFRKFKTYIMVGSIYRKKLNVAYCDFWKEWGRITKKLRSGFARKFARSCECKVTQCYGMGCGSLKDPYACALDVSSGRLKNTCRHRYQYCELSKDGKKCSWNTNLLYRKCISRIP